MSGKKLTTRVSVQLEIFLTHLLKIGFLNSNEVKLQKLSRMYGQQHIQIHPVPPYKNVHKALLEDGYVLQVNADDPNILYFNVSKIHAFLQRNNQTIVKPIPHSACNTPTKIIQSAKKKVLPQPQKVKKKTAKSNVPLQAKLFLIHLHKCGQLNNNEVKHQTLKLSYGVQTRKVMPTPCYQDVHDFLLKKGYIVQKSVENIDIFQINVFKAMQFLKNNSTNGLQSSKSANSSPEPKQVSDASKPKASNVKLPSVGNALKKEEQNLVAKKSPIKVNPESQSQDTNPRGRGGIFIDQRYNFAIKGRSSPQSFSGSRSDFFCNVCGIDMKEKHTYEIHVGSSDEHAFKKLYQDSKVSNLLDKSKPPPPLLSGECIGVTIQSAKSQEGSGAYSVKLFLTETELMKKQSVSTNIHLLVHYKPINNKNIQPLFLSHIMIIHGKSNLYLNGNQQSKEAVKEGCTVQKFFRIQESKIGEAVYIIAFKFLQQNPYEEFFVMKKICVRVDSEATKEPKVPTQKKPSAQAKKSKQKEKPKEENSQDFILTIPTILEEADQPNINKGELKYVRKLREYALPMNYTKFFNSGFEINAKNITPDMMSLKCEVLNTLVGGLTKQNYDHYFSLLLFLEEHQTLCDLKTHSLKDAPLRKKDKNSKLITIVVPGLAENRPSVVRGDAIHLLVKGTGVYKGYVRDVASTTISVCMGARFMGNFIDNMKASVYFTFNRSSLKLEHFALELMKSSKQVMQVCFPQTCGKYIKETPILSWYNRLVYKNPEQSQAVQCIVNGTSLPSPYLLFGPPGTGKTVTLVETMAQIFQNGNSFILATAPSNAAADVLAERLVTILPPSQILRMYSPSREWNQVPENLKRICNFIDKECVFPALKELLKFRVIISTLICAGRLVRANCPEGHFTHIFVDECGHGMEPTALVPVASLLGCEPRPGQLVLSGDPKQLGPIIRSPVAKQLGLGLSLLERLMTSCDLYQKKYGNYNPHVLTKLVKNFRSHPAILKIPNELFYDGELQACGEIGMTHSICNWNELPNKEVPIIFHGIEGQETIDEGTPSLFNISEVNLVVQYVEKILYEKFRGQRLLPSDIGVISPYRAQLTKLHRALERKKIAGLRELTVGSVEEFQGQERRVIILSTVRSNPAQVCLDRKYRLGFVKEPKRFNVALTRAKALVIVIGNPHVLETDANWHRLLEWVMQCRAYKGCKFTLGKAPLPSDPDEEICPVREKLEQQLALSREVVANQRKNASKWSEGTDLDKIMQQIKSLSFLSEASELETMVSPPFTTQEQ